MLSNIRLGTAITGSAGWTALAASCGRLHLALKPPDERLAIRDTWVKWWARGLLTSLRVQPISAGPLLEPTPYPRLILSNHRTPFDIPLIASHFGGAFLSRADLSSWPVIGAAAQHAGTIFVDRGNGKSARSAVNKLRERLQARETLITFPEGSTFAGDEVRPLKRGVFVAAANLDIELIVIGVAYPPGLEFTEDSMSAYMKRVYTRPNIPVALVWDYPIRLNADARTLRGESHTRMSEMVTRARALL